MAGRVGSKTLPRLMGAGASCEGFGWCMGKITRVNDDARRSIGGDKINFFAHYEIDGEEEPDVPHVLQLSEYQTTDDAGYDSWLLLEEAVGVPAEAATEAVEPEPGVPAEAATVAVEPRWSRSRWRSQRLETR